MAKARRYAVTRIEKRKMERFSLELPARLTWSGKDKRHESMEQLTSNICAGGAFFKTQKPLLIGTDLKIIITLPLKKYKNIKSKISYIRVSGSVIRMDQQGMAIRFDKKYKISPY